MPEISICVFDLKFLFKLFPKTDTEYQRKLSEYEKQTQEIMAQNRSRLFCS